MAYFIEGYPYSDTHNLNLDWIIDKIKRLETEYGLTDNGLEIRVLTEAGSLAFTFSVKSNGVYITRPDGGTPFFYDFQTGTLHAPIVDSNSTVAASGRFTGDVQAGSASVTGAVQAGSANITGAVQAGSAALTAPLPISSGGTGAGTAAAARNGLGVPRASGTVTTQSIAVNALERINVTGQFNTSDYIVITEVGSVGSMIGISNKSANGFTITVYNRYTEARAFTVKWAVIITAA